MTAEPIITQPIIRELHTLDVESGINEDGEPFVVVRATFHPDGGHPIVLRGQSTPELARRQGNVFHDAATAALADAALFEVARQTAPDDPDEALHRAGVLIGALREIRRARDTDPDR